MSFKDTIKSDINIFFNENEFSEKHLIDQVEMDVIIDDYELIDRDRRRGDIDEGNYVSKKMIFVKAEQFGELPSIDTVLELDNTEYSIVDATNEQGVYSITLEAIES